MIWKVRLMFRAEPEAMPASNCIVLLPAKINCGTAGELGVAPKLGPWETPTTPDRLVTPPVKVLAAVRFTKPAPLLLMVSALLPLIIPASVSVLPPALLTVRLSPRTKAVAMVSPLLVET